MPNSSRVEIPGLADLRRDLKEMPKDVQKVLPQEFKRVAEKVVDDARSRMPQKSGDAAAGVIAKATSTGPSIVEKREPAYLRWLDFGSYEPVTGNPRKVGPWHGSGVGPKGGRFVYPAVKENMRGIYKACLTAVDKAAERAGFR
jgi:hypothetical protein